MNWFRVELDRSGAILRCTQIEAVEENKRLVCYVQAVDKAEACSKAKSWSAERIAARKATFQRRRDEGKCARCERPAVPGQKTCSAHRPLSAAARANQQAAWDRAAAREAAKEACGELPRILRRFDALGPEKFRSWLVAEIECRSLGGAGAALDLSDNEG
jgi:hypothetical protein